MRHVLLLLCLSMLGGCFRYAPVGSEPPVRGTAVRAHLAAPADFRVGEITHHQVVEVAGEVIQVTEREIHLSATLLRTSRGFEYPGDGHTVSLDRAAVERLEVRRLAAERSGLLIGAALAAGTLGARAIGFGGGKAGRDGGNGTVY